MKKESAAAKDWRPPAANRHFVRWLVLTWAVGAALLVLPLAFTIEGYAVAANYAGNPDPTSQGHASEAMLGGGFGLFLGMMVLIVCTIVAAQIARHAGLNVLGVTLGGAVLMVLVALPVSWLLVRPVGGAWLA
ncbi:hypothetical protein [Agromyces sp. ZXT2-3]|uniref:hypothetical protein n=1 Tax=Agromyces sp. ZXT2-3 TaxID=3461152 RepID=UPI00405506B8